MASPADPVVLVTGATGFIAGHILQQLLNSNKFQVRGTVRSVSSAAKQLSYLRKDTHKYELELVQGRLTHASDWITAVRGCHYIIHTASPFPLDVPSDPMEVISPAVEGVENVFRAALDCPTVRRIVLTSSVAAVYGGRYARGTHIFTESDWTDESRATPYDLSKTYAERRAWELISGEHNQGRALPIECVAINPSLVFGPVMNGRTSTSMEVVVKLMRREVPVLPDTYFSCVDVRDVAQAHIRALTASNVNGRRLLCSSETLSLRKIAKTLDAGFGDLGYKIPTTRAPDVLIHILSLWTKVLREQIKPLLGFEPLLDTTPIQRELGMRFIPAHQSIVDMTTSLIQYGQVPSTPQIRSQL